MRFGSGGPRDIVDPDGFYEDDAYWEATRGHNDVRRSHDPLVRRIKELRAQSTTELRRRLDVLKYSPAGQRCARLRKKLDRGGHLTLEEHARLADYESRLAVLYAELDRGGRSGSSRRGGARLLGQVDVHRAPEPGP